MVTVERLSVIASFSVSLALALRGDRTSELNIVCFPESLGLWESKVI